MTNLPRSRSDDKTVPLDVWLLDDQHHDDEDALSRMATGESIASRTAAERTPTAHTSEPWSWFTGRNVAAGAPCVKHLVGGNGQGFGLTVGLPEPEDTLNANLMIAAPALLAACKLALNAFERNDAIDWGVLEAAVAKAEGRS
jgi:hypothetical protein